MIYLLHGNRQAYAWGGFSYIPHLLGEAQSQEPVAELWFGDHAQAPAQIEYQGTKQALNTWLAAHLEQVISPTSIQRFGKRLPYLLKILDVRLPLSIQLHPDKALAEQGFAQENLAKIALNAPYRNYKDDNHKPENMIALSEFWLLHGFAAEALILERIRARPSLASIGELIQDKGLAKAYREIMQADQAQLSAWLTPLLAQAAPQSVSDNPDYWLHYTVEAMQIVPEKLDAGLVCFYLFNIVKMRIGEGIFQRARLPHAYLRGQNIELMAASDNVLRAGLTPKHIDIPELLRIIDSTEVRPEIIPSPSATHQGLYAYPAPVEDYAFYSMRLAAGERFTLSCKEASILLVIQGRLEVQEHHEVLSLTSAQAVFVSFGSQITLQAQQDAYFVLATNH